MALHALGWPQQALTSEERATWSSIRRSILFVQGVGRATAPAVCIDSKGLFIVHREGLGGGVLTGRLDSGLLVTASVLAVDDVTQLALISVNAPSGAGFKAVKPISADSKPSKKLIAVVGGEAIRAEVNNTSQLGILSESRRAVPLVEVQFEALTSQVAGTPVFSMEGELVGILNATLPVETKRDRPASDGNSVAGAGFGGTFVPTLSQQYGPGGLTVAYSVAPAVLRRVFEGFRSPSHRVLHPSIGVYCKDFFPSGAEIQSVLPASPADFAGMRPGDVITEIAGKAVRTQLDFARIMFEREVGENLEVTVFRNGRALKLKVLVSGLFE